MPYSSTTLNVTLSGSIKPSTRLADQTGSVLATVLVTLMILLAIFISAMTYALSRYGKHVQNHNRLIARYLAEAGVAHRQATFESQGITFDTSSWKAPNGGTISTITEPWGPYLLVDSKGLFANQSVHEFAILGSMAPRYMDGAVTVFDPGTPLVVAGNTRIVGDAFTGPMGIMEGHFRGEGTTFEDYLRGTNYREAVVRQFEPDSTIMLAYLRSVSDRRLQATHQVMGSLVLGPEDGDPFAVEQDLRIRNDLLISNARMLTSEGVKSIFVDGQVEIAGTSHLSDLFEIVAEEFIVLRDSSVLGRTLLMARDSIVIEGNAVFGGIAVCPGRLIVREQAQLVNPSALFCPTSSKKAGDSSGIFLQSRGWTESVVVLERNCDPDSRSRRTVYVDTATVFRGLILSSEQADIRGAVFGSVATKQFHFEYPPTTYINWLTDCYIDRSKLTYRPELPVLNAIDSISSLATVSQVTGRP